MARAVPWRRAASRAAAALFLLLLVVDLAYAISRHEHWIGDVPTMLLWEGPLLLLAALLRSGRRGVRRLTVLLAMLFALWAAALLVGNWHSQPPAWRSYLAVTQILYVGICLAAVLVEAPAFHRTRGRRKGAGERVRGAG